MAFDGCHPNAIVLAFSDTICKHGCIWVRRHFWLNLLEQACRERSVVWLAGVRGVGKTYLCQSLPNIEYFDCELPRVRRMMEDPQSFLDSLRGRRTVLDEIHRLPNPSELLKIAADHYPNTRIVVGTLWSSS